jgi:pyridoxal 5'-phosphate synthase pdxS subunit
MYLTDEFRLKIGLAEQLKGGVIMDVTNAEQALIAEKAGANAVMALERVPSDIRKEGGVARMAPISKIREIMATVSIPVMAKCRIGHFAEASILEALKVDYIIRAVAEHPLTRGREFRLHGFVWPRYWYHRDARRAERGVGLELRTNALLWPVLTPADVDAVKDLIGERLTRRSDRGGATSGA